MPLENRTLTERFQSNLHLQILIHIYELPCQGIYIFKQIHISFSQLLFSLSASFLIHSSTPPCPSSLPLLLYTLLPPSSTSPLFSTGEFLSLAAMDTFLRSVQPEVNDLFVLSLVLINLFAWMDLFITQVTSCFSIGHSDGKSVEKNVLTPV